MNEFSNGDRKIMSDREPLEVVLEFMQHAKQIISEEMPTGFQTAWKEDNTPVTQIDKRINAAFIAMIADLFPGDVVIGEEESSEGKPEARKWVIDPIDGTQGMLAGLPTYTVCVARLDQDGKPELAVVMNPSTDELFIAEEGKPTTLNGEEIKVSDTDSLKSSLVYMSSRMNDDTASFGTIADRLLVAGAKPFNVRSVAYGCLEVARGRFAAAFAGVKTPFEIASVKLIAENAGATVTDLIGNPIERCDGEINGFLITNGKVHDEMLELLSKEHN